MHRFLGVVALLASGFSWAQANTPIPKPVCDTSKEVSVRYSSTSQRIYIESLDGSRGGCTSLSSVYQALGDTSPLYPLEKPGEWLLEESLYILDGITLNIHGTSVGGDCDYLKLRSDSEMFVNLRAHGGSLDLMNTKVTSWDLSADDVDNDLADGRSYISAISEVVLDPTETCEGAAKNNMGESRMDVQNSEIAYLGYEESESWGLSWKLRGICNDKSNRDKYQGYGVYGNLLGSDVHNLYYGHYGYAHSYALLTNNKVSYNEIYGFDPHDDSVNLTISDNNVFFNGHHGIIWSKYCHNTIVTGNHVYDNGGVGIFPHFVGNNALIAHNVIERNFDSGIAFLESSGGRVYNNTVKSNVHGIRFSVGSRDNVIAENTFEDNQGYDVYQYEGNDPVAEVENGNPTNNVFFANKFSGNVGGARLDDSEGTQFVSNTVKDWDSFEMRDSSNTLIQGNTFPAELTYTSTSSCINSASDVAFGDVCSNPAMTNPFDQSDYEKIVGDRGVETTPTATQGPSDSQTLLPISTTTPTGSSAFTASPTALYGSTATPTASSRSFVQTPVPSVVPRDVILPSDSSSGVGGGHSDDGGGSWGKGGGGGSSIDDSNSGGGGASGGSNDGDNDGCTGGSARALDSMSPTPSQVAPGIPVAPETTDDTAQDVNGSISRLAHDISAWICLAVALIVL